jgi:uncharacterized protein
VNTYIASLLAAWVAAVARRPRTTVLLVLLAALFAGVYAAGSLRLQGDVTELVDSDASFLRNYDAHKASFPQHRRLNVVVIDGQTALQARTAMDALIAGMGTRGDLFDDAYAPGKDPFLRRHALIFLEPAALEQLVDRLAQAQPALAILARDPSLRGLALLFARVQEEGSDPQALAPLAEIIARSARDVSRGAGEPVSWAEILLGDTAPTRQLIIFQGSLEGDDGQVARAQAAAVREIVTANGLLPENGVTVRMTGRGPLSSAELESAVSSIQTVGLVSLGFVAVLLWLGLGSLRAILAAITTLLVGLVLTAAFATLAVGSLNVLSLTFAVLFIGLGIDFAVHMILRRVREGAADDAEAWSRVGRGLGPTILLCGLTTAIAFLAFWPTGFRGLAELGLISAMGMVIAVVMSFTFLPAMLELLRVRARADRPGRMSGWASGAALADRIVRLSKPISVAAIVVLLGATILGAQVKFDFNSLNLQDHDSEAVATLVALHEDGTITPYTLTVAADDMAAADRIAERLREIPEVGRVKTLRDLVPKDQSARLALLDEAMILLGPAVMSGRVIPMPDESERQAAVIDLIARGKALAGSDPQSAFAQMSDALATLDGMNTGGAPATKLEALIAEDFVASLEMLRDTLSAEPVSLESLPGALIARETGVQGQVRVVALPRDDLRDFTALGQFVRAVQAEFPTASGRPALEAGVGEIVVDAFRQAFATAAVAIFLVLVIALRSFIDGALVMLPLLLAAALTTGTMVVLGIPLNVANVIVLPLLLGMGVDNGLHVVGRFRETGSIAAVYRSSTPRAVLVSVLTTLLSFVALAFADHRGMASMGQLLAIAIGFILFATLIVLPALLAWRVQRT